MPNMMFTMPTVLVLSFVLVATLLSQRLQMRKIWTIGVMPDMHIASLAKIEQYTYGVFGVPREYIFGGDYLEEK